MISSNSDRKILMWGVIILLLFPTYNFYLNGIIQYRFGMGSISALSYILMAVIGVWSYIKIKDDKKTKSSMIIVLLFLGTSLSYIIYPKIRTTLIAPGYNPIESQAVMLFLYCVPAMILLRFLRDWREVFMVMAKLSMILIPIAIYSYWIQIMSLGVMKINYMSISTFLVLPICFICSYGYLIRKWYPFVFAIVGIVFVFTCGSRGALLCSLMSLGYCVYRIFKHSGLFYKVAMGIAFVVFIGYFGASFVKSSESVSDLGYSRGRTLEKIESGSFFISAGREEIDRVVDAGISNNPFGYGLFGDRYVMEKGGLPPSYCHSIIREFICDFGVIIGSFLLVYLVYTLYCMRKRINDKYAYEVLVILICSGLVHLLMSGTYLTDILFWAMIGIILNPYIKTLQIRK